MSGLLLSSEVPNWIGRSCELGQLLGAEVFVTDRDDRVIFANDAFAERRRFLDFTARPAYGDCYRREVEAGFVAGVHDLEGKIQTLRNMRMSPQLTFSRRCAESVDKCFHERRGDWAVRLSVSEARVLQIAEDSERVNSLQHLAKAYRVSLASISALDVISIGIILAYSGGVISYYNTAMDEILWTKDGISIGSLGRIEAVTERDTIALRAAITNAARNADSLPRVLQLPRRSGRGHHLLTVCYASPGVAMLQVAPPIDGTRELRHLLAGVGLTEAQADVAEELGRGIVSEDSTKTAGTRRNHVKGVLKAFRDKEIVVNGQQGIASIVARLASISGKLRR